MSRRRWSDPEAALLAAMYPHCHTADVAAWIGRSVGQCYQHANGCGLRKTPEYLASDTACRVKRGQQNEAMKASRFKPGLIPWNKGVKGSTGTQEACRRTPFLEVPPDQPFLTTNADGSPLPNGIASITRHRIKG